MLLTLFFVGFVSATLWPLASEAVFLVMVQQQPERIWLLYFAVALGNWLGAVVMFELARNAAPWLAERLQPVRARVQRVLVALKRHGAILLGLAWLPLVGDLLPVCAGMLGLPRGACYAWLLLGKVARYGVLLWLTVRYAGLGS
jgi:membrane protein YqaA with SNARE-associated domain